MWLCTLFGIDEAIKKEISTFCHEYAIVQNLLGLQLEFSQIFSCLIH